MPSPKQPTPSRAMSSGTGTLADLNRRIDDMVHQLEKAGLISHKEATRILSRGPRMVAAP